MYILYSINSQYTTCPQKPFFPDISYTSLKIICSYGHTCPVLRVFFNSVEVKTNLKAYQISDQGGSTSGWLSVICTVGAKSITCAKSITRYDINGHNISKFLNFCFFFLFLLPNECKNNNFKMKIGIFVWEYVMIDTKNYFVYCQFFCRRFFHHCSTFRGANLLLKRACIPKTASPF